MLKKFSLSMLIAALSMPLAAHAQEGGGDALAPKLQKMAAEAVKRYPVETLKIFQDAVATVKATGVEEQAKQVGDKAIDAELSGWDGSNVKLSELWKEGPVVLMWYRGGWCPYCNIQLRAMQQKLAAIEGAGARLVVLTPELPEKAKETAESNDLSMVALHDRDSELAKKYGLLFQLPESIVPAYRDRIQLGDYSGNDRMELPLSATYVIDTSGIITYAFLDADYKKRAEPSEVLKAVHEAKK
ncbi:peroxiredoxin [Rhodopirellula rubra]|uniref:thioredoxin-dependent peroxiredoxin n=1 Tax=Aporhodopirellula rubra TaxID=980271 RepID=A0A7W5DZ04_9BACT|nr:peroxiredoxin-like family protein [Aporhodopirellula rubra]MBB3206809.1 peroxiredoxin [Aporhodopirellula rubra]